MKNAKIKFSFLSTMSNLEFENAAATIAENFENEVALFPSPTVTVPTLNAAVQDLEEKNQLADSDNGSHNDRTARDIQRNTVYEMLVINGAYVLTIANSRETYEERKAVVEAAGYPLANETHEPIVPVQVTSLSVQVPTIPGDRTIKARWKRGKCNSFVVQGTNGDPGSPSTEWTQLYVGSRAKCSLTLAPGQWAIRVIGLYSAGEAPASNNVQFVIS